MNRKLFLLPVLILIVFINTSYSQSSRWSSISYSYTKGPVSPEYQYSYKIVLNEAGDGKLIYTKASDTKEYDFRTGKKGLKKLIKALKKSKVFTTDTEKMRSGSNRVGGPEMTMNITMWQSPLLDARPTVIQVPSQLNETYSANINKVYEILENLVPKSVWDTATR